MPPPPNNDPQNPVTENALFVIRVDYDKAHKLIKLIFDKGKLIQDLMNPEQKQATGLKKLSAQELANLDAFLDPDKVLAPGDPPHHPA